MNLRQPTAGILWLWHYGHGSVIGEQENSQSALNGGIIPS
jgi:hypothetical protein